MCLAQGKDDGAMLSQSDPIFPISSVALGKSFERMCFRGYFLIRHGLDLIHLIRQEEIESWTMKFDGINEFAS